VNEDQGNTISAQDGINEILLPPCLPYSRGSLVSAINFVLVFVQYESADKQWEWFNGLFEFHRSLLKHHLIVIGSSHNARDGFSAKSRSIKRFVLGVAEIVQSGRIY
jgi:hypothetical protein